MARAEAGRKQNELPGTAVRPAEAEGMKARLFAEAEGMRKKADSFTNLDESSKVLMILQQYPQIIAALAPVANAVSAPMDNIDHLVVLGGGSGANGPDRDNMVSRLTGTIPSTVYQLLQVSKALGIDLSDLLRTLGIRADGQAQPPANDSSNKGEADS
ncbi:hypothetical protein HY229_08370 [Candidatus Acetothermia bacterium]|nr:hypothetical protein [Candidatus Acetothermia bacterium]MBI3644096.1 hypothetical protein [Candidatus Acetothermia bacterium]